MTICHNCDEGIQYKHDYRRDSPDGLKPVSCECCNGEWRECQNCADHEWELEREMKKEVIDD